MGFLDGGGASLFNSIFSGLYLSGTLYRPNDTPNGAGGGTIGWHDGEAVKLQQESATEAMRQTQGYTALDVRFLMLAQGVDRPDTDCQLGFGGTRYAIVGPVGRDPCGAYYDIHARPIGEDQGDES